MTKYQFVDMINFFFFYEKRYKQFYDIGESKLMYFPLNNLLFAPWLNKRQLQVLPKKKKTRVKMLIDLAWLI